MATTTLLKHIKVDLIINAKNRKQKIVFGLEKNTTDETVEWIIHFKLFQRDDVKVAYDDPLVSLDVEVESALHAKAEKAAKLGLTAGQIAHAEGPAASDALAVANGDMDEAEGAATVQATLKKK